MEEKRQASARKENVQQAERKHDRPAMHPDAFMKKIGIGELLADYQQAKNAFAQEEVLPSFIPRIDQLISHGQRERTALNAFNGGSSFTDTASPSYSRPEASPSASSVVNPANRNRFWQAVEAINHAGNTVSSGLLELAPQTPLDVASLIIPQIRLARTAGVAAKSLRQAYYFFKTDKPTGNPHQFTYNESAFPGGSVGAGRTWTKSARIKTAELPKEGRIRFIPGKNYHPSNPLVRGPNNGYLDNFGNEWTKGPSRTPGQAFEWDIQLSHSGRKQLGWASRDGRHVNVSLDGKLTHL